MPSKVLADSLLCTSQFLRTCEVSHSVCVWWGGGAVVSLFMGDMKGFMKRMYTPHSGPQDLATQSTRQSRGQHAASWVAAGFTGPEELVLRVYSLFILTLCSVCFLSG